MRKSVTIDLEGKPVEIKELSNKEIFTLLEKFPQLLTDGLQIKQFPAMAREIIPTCTNLKIAEFEELPARLTINIFKAFQEVNQDFLQTLHDLGKAGTAELKAELRAEVAKIVELKTTNQA